jgi:hypothetical protein
MFPRLITTQSGASPGITLINQRALLHQIIFAAGSQPGVCSFIDSTTDEGAFIMTVTAAANTTFTVDLRGFPVRNGLHAITSGTGCSLTVFYE